MKDIYIIKLGGSIITDKTKPYTPRRKVIQRIVKELTAIHKPFILIHGSGSFGHTSAKKYGGQKGYVSTTGVAKVAHDAVTINAIVMEVLMQANLPAISLRPMSMFFATSGKKSHAFFYPLEELLNQKFIPVLYGDGILDRNWKTTIFSGEKIGAILATFLQKKGWRVTVIQLTNTDGVYDNTGKTIKNISQKTWLQVKKHIYATDDVTGGMLHKIESSLDLAKQHVKTIIINGETPKELLRAIENKKINGTIIRL